MSSDPTLNAVELFVLLVTAAALVALVARRLSLPYSVVLVVLGLAIAAIGPARAIEITPQLVLVVLVPGLVFEAAYRLDVVELRRTFLGVAILAVPGVVISAGTVALVLSATGLPIQLAFIVGAITSATDPASVVSTFKALRAPRGLATLVEAESLFNDGTAIVVFSIALGALATPVSPLEAVASFTGTVVVSTVIGLAFGVVATRLMLLAGDHLVELTISLALAYGTYLAADQLRESGIIATVVAGLVLGTYGRRIELPESTFTALDTVWEFAAFLLTALVFLLIGLAITIGQLVDDAMSGIERDNPSLKGVLPKDYARPALDKLRLGQLIDLVSNIKIGDAESRSKDVIGRVYEYFLSQFASAEGKKGGEFYTPRCVVKLLVEMLEPYTGRVYDPCCGSSGMFVQSVE
ncbi:MAG TPA: cation:proton antiporter, partial [Candidatus Binatia bacterium]|nr:cation:proton antiporter [Candidatus Binatia bacterium]